MADFTLNLSIPDALILPLARDLAAHMGVATPTTNAQRKALLEAFLRHEAKRVYLDAKDQRAREAARDDDSDGAKSW